MNETPKGKWTPRVIQGGLAHGEDTKPAARQEKPVTPEVLVREWNRVLQNAPVNWSTSINQLRVKEARQTVRGYSMKVLYSMLCAPDFWTRPSFARALTDEVAARMKRQNFDASED